MEALATTVTRRSILAREKQEGLTLGLDSGSTTTKAVLMENNKVIGTGWTSTKDIIASAQTAAAEAFEGTGYKWDDVDGIGTTGYGRTRLSELVGLPQKTSLHLLKLQLQRHLKELATNGKMLMV